MGNFFFLAI